MTFNYQSPSELNKNTTCLHDQQLCYNGKGVIHILDEDHKLIKAKICEHNQKCKELRDQKARMKKLLRFADLPDRLQSCTIKDFQIDIYESSQDQKRAGESRKMIAGSVENIEKLQTKGTGIYLWSSVKGSGKTRLMVGLANALIQRKQKEVKFLTTVDLLEKIKETFDNEVNTGQLINAVKETDILILDDIGVETAKDWIQEKFYAILNYRLNSDEKVTFFTSNCPINDLPHSDRIKSRIEKMAIEKHMAEENVRRKIAKQENKELEKLLLSY